MIGGFATLNSFLVIIAVLMCATNRLQWVNFPEIGACYVMTLVSYSSQAAREASNWSDHGRRTRDAWMYRLRCLIFYTFTSPVKKKGFDDLSQIRTSRNCLQIVILMLDSMGRLRMSTNRLSQLGAHEQGLKRKISGKAFAAVPSNSIDARRSSTVFEELLLTQKELGGVRKATYSHYSVLQVSQNTAVPQIIVSMRSSFACEIGDTNNIVCTNFFHMLPYSQYL